MGSRTAGVAALLSSLALASLAVASVALAQTVLHYRSAADIERGIAMTRSVLAASQSLARSRGAYSLLVVPEFKPQRPVEILR